MTDEPPEFVRMHRIGDGPPDPRTAPDAPLAEKATIAIGDRSGPMIVSDIDEVIATCVQILVDRPECPNAWVVLQTITKLVYDSILNLQDCECADWARPVIFQAPRKTPIPPALRRIVLERDAYRCQHCDSWFDLAVDHIIPESKGGLTALENLQTLCRPCNSRKGATL